MYFQLASLVLATSVSLVFATAPQEEGMLGRMKRDVTALAGPEMAGRGNGQEGLDRAVDYLVDSYKSMGLQTEIQRFFYRFASSDKDGPDGQLANVMVTIDGSDPELSSQHIVVGAHLDHLGTRPSSDGESPVVFYGADDNASGTAAVMELVRHYRSNPPSRTLLFIHFAGEEWGLLGSNHWIANPSIDISSVRLMANLDMIGRLDPDSAILTFTAVGMGWEAIAKAKAAAPSNINVEADRGTSIFSRASDHAPFAANNIPTFFLFTGIHPDYHRPTDTIDKINWDGLVTITQYAQRLITEYATSKEAPKFQPRPNLGMFIERGEVAPRVWRVGPGSSAESAGLRRGDLLTCIDQHEIDSPEGLERTLDMYNRGDRVKLVWEREKKQMSAEVVLQ